MMPAAAPLPVRWASATAAGLAAEERDACYCQPPWLTTAAGLAQPRTLVMAVGPGEEDAGGALWGRWCQEVWFL